MSDSKVDTAASTPAEPAWTLAGVLPWVARVAWIVIAVLGGAALEAGVDDRSSAVRWVVAIGAWVVFAAVAVALLIPSVWALTVVRLGSPLVPVAAIVAGVFGASGAEIAFLAVPGVVVVAAVFSAEVGRWMVQASAYGDEDRLLLRSPAAAGAAALVSWVVWAAVVISAPLLLAAANFAVGVPVAIAAVATTVLLVPRWHKMSRRWLVLVPAGLVVHDPVVLADTLMVRTDQLVGLGLARSDTEAADLTGPASGYALQVDTSETVSTVFAFTPQEPNGKAIHMTGFLVAPSRPGEALRIAARRRLPIR